MRIGWLVCAALATGACSSRPSVEELFDQRRWFELRAALEQAEAGPLIEGAVAAAFHDRAPAEESLNLAIRRSRNPHEANQAREALINIHLREGRYRSAVELLDQILKTEDTPDARNVRDLFSRLPDMEVAANTPASFACEVSGEVVSLPLTINGQQVSWWLDTGFNASAVSEQEARMLGLTLVQGAGNVTDLAGGSVRTPVALAESVTIGGLELQDVSMLVLSDTALPMSELPAGRRGIVGLPAALALGRIHWTREGQCGTGGDTAPRSDPNLVFDGLNPVLGVGYEGRELEFLFDTGNAAGSQVWRRFSADFPDLVREQGKPGTVRISQVGGSNDHAVIVLPELRLRVGGFDTMLRPANVFGESAGNGAQHGNLGMDLLSQAAEVEIDFGAMSVMLR